MAPLTRYDEQAKSPEYKSVPLTVIILTRNEEANISRCINSVRWANQVIVVDCGSTDATCDIARAMDAEVVDTYWRGFGAQREFSLRLPLIQHAWVFFVDADEWVSTDLAEEIAGLLATESDTAAYWLHKRLIFQGRWMRHSGWYPGARYVQLMRRTRASYKDEAFSEHPMIKGAVRRLHADLVDQDQKGLQSWLEKHVRYASLEAERRAKPSAAGPRPPYASRLRYLLKDRIWPRLPCRPFALFLYMYVIRAGFLDGRQGLLFCFYHCWFQVTVEATQSELASSSAWRETCHSENAST